MLEDRFGRRFHYLRLSITELCNFRCNYCLPEGNPCDVPKDVLNLLEIQTLITAFAKLGTGKVRITGGEPALRKDLIDIIQICRNTTGIQTVALSTNAFNLEQQAQAYKQAGLDALNVSADSLDPRMFATITGKNKLQDVLNGIDAALSAGIAKVKLNSVMMKQFNAKDLHLFLDYLRDKSVTWRFIELMQTGTNQDFFNDNHVSGDVIKTQLLDQGWQRTIRDKTAGPAQEFSHPNYQGRMGLIMPYSKDFCHSCNRLRISSTGKLHLCLFSETGLDIRAYLSSGDVTGTCEVIQHLLTDKKVSHELHQGKSGAIQQFALIGG
jgi:cyclic pyranopterin phosphate synthase